VLLFSPEDFQMHLRNVVLALFVLTMVAFAQNPITADSPFQVNYAANLQIGESWINVVNTGANGAALLGPGFGPVGNICVNVYAFTPDEQLVSCCSCLVTPNGLVHFGAYASLASNTMTPGAGYLPGFNAANGTGGLVIKLVSTLAGGTGNSTSCTNSAASLTAAGTVLATGMAAWRTTVHNAPPTPVTGAPGVPYGVTETRFTPATLSAGEIASISGRCAAIIGNASGYGICRGCSAGALGASARF
jgi:hypothetical protein